MTARNNIFFYGEYIYSMLRSTDLRSIQSMSIEFSTFQCAHPWPQPLPENASWHCCTQCGCNPIGKWQIVNCSSLGKFFQTFQAVVEAKGVHIEKY